MSDDQSEEVHAGFVGHGRVQGVGFRWWTRRIATDLNLRGSVRNRSDGTVEVRARGPVDAVERLADDLRCGPRGAGVARVQRFDPGPVGGSSFQIEP
jgi:acylphosphatase